MSSRAPSSPQRSRTRARVASERRTSRVISSVAAQTSAPSESSPAPGSSEAVAAICRGVEADRGGELLVLLALVARFGEVGDAEDRQLPQGRGQVLPRQERRPELEERPQGRRQSGDGAKDVEGRKRRDDLACLGRELFIGGKREAGVGH